MGELDTWLDSDRQKLLYTFNQVLGNLAAVAYQNYLNSGQVTSHGAIVKLAADTAEAALRETRDRWGDKGTGA